MNKIILRNGRRGQTSWCTPMQPTMRHVIRIMKLLYVMIFLFCTGATASVRGQEVHIATKGASFYTVIQKVQKQTGYSFAISDKHMRQAKPVYADVKTNLKDALPLIFEDQPFGYRLEGKIIVSVDRDLRGEKQGSVQQRSMLGTVVDSTGAPLKGVSVYLTKDPTRAVQTDFNGRFAVSGDLSGERFTFSLVGYVKKEQILKSSSEMHFIRLQLDDRGIDEVVVSTGVFDRKKETYTGAVTVVSAEELAKFGNRNLITSLRNFDPTFNVVANNSFGSDPNRMPEIQIRGNSSLPNVNDLKDDTRAGINTPLIIFDGFESTLERLLDINQNEVESVTILKDAAATAIYGSRGANGVLVIKTKLPKAGKLMISYSGNLNVETPDLTAYNLLGAKDKLELERIAGLYNSNDAAKDLRLKSYYSFLLNEVNRGVETDWLAIPLHLGIGQRHNLGVSGGSESLRYSASAYVNNIEGVMKGSSRNTFSGTINLSYHMKKVRFNNMTTISVGKNSQSPYGNFTDYAQLNPYWTPYDKMGRISKLLGRPDEEGVNKDLWESLPTNPLYDADLNTFDISKSTNISNQFSLDWEIINKLMLRARVGVSMSNGDSDKYLPSDHTSFAYTADFFRRGSYNYGINKGQSYDGGLNLSYSKSFDKHNIFAGLDYNIRENKGYNYGFSAEGFIEPRFDFISMAQQYALGSKPTGAEFLKRSVGFTSALTYNYDNRYTLEGSLRADGGSQFGKLNRFAPFWSVGLGWNIKNESFMKDVEAIDQLRLRGSVGITGSLNFDAYQALPTYRYVTGDRYFNWIGADMVSLGNEKLKWQQEKSYNLGIDAGFFNKNLLFGVDVYQSKTNGLISSVNLPASVGFPNYIENIGNVSNKGIELKTTVIPVRRANLNWSISAAIVSNINKIDKLSDALKEAQREIENSAGTSPANLYREGNPIGTIWAVKSLGIDPSTGKELLLDRFGKPTFTWSSLDLVNVGLSEPKYRGNLNTMLRYKSFSVNLSFGYRFGGQLFNQTLMDKVENVQYLYNVDARVYEDRWKQPGDQVGFKGIQVTGQSNATSRFVQNENTLTLQNAYFAYEFNKDLIRRFRLSNLTLAANMGDVFYISSVRQERGLSYPFSRQLSFSLNAMF